MISKNLPLGYNRQQRTTIQTYTFRRT